MKYSEQYKKELQEAKERKKKIEEEYNELQKKLEPLRDEETKIVNSLYELDGHIRDLKRELRHAWILENFDEDSMYVEGINI
jgi:archaellum component FlaC